MNGQLREDIAAVRRAIVRLVAAQPISYGPSNVLEPDRQLLALYVECYHALRSEAEWLLQQPAPPVSTADLDMRDRFGDIAQAYVAMPNFDSAQPRIWLGGLAWAIALERRHQWRVRKALRAHERPPHRGETLWVAVVMEDRPIPARNPPPPLGKYFGPCGGPAPQVDPGGPRENIGQKNQLPEAEINTIRRMLTRASAHLLTDDLQTTRECLRDAIGRLGGV